MHAPDNDDADLKTDLDHPAPDEDERAEDGFEPPNPAVREGGPARTGPAAMGAAVLARLPGWVGSPGSSSSRWVLCIVAGLDHALRPRLSRLGATIAAGMLLRASFPVLDWWWAGIIAFGLLACVLVRPATTPAGGFGYGFLFGLAFYLPLLPWIGQLVGAMPWIALSIVCAVFPGIFALLAVVVRRLPGWPIWFAALWAAQEWLKSSVPFGGFPWGVAAFGQTDGPFLPLVWLGGAPLLSLAIVLIGCSTTAIGLEIVWWWHRARQTRMGPDSRTAIDGVGNADSLAGTPPAVVLPGICICLVLFTTVIVWPQVRHSGMGSGNDPVVTVAAVQGNVPRLGLDFNAQRRAVLDNHVRETLRLADDVHAGLAAQPQFVIWPENASDIDPLANADAAQQISAAAEAIAAPILVGAVVDAQGGPPLDDPAYTNAVIVWNPATGPAERHNKQIVQPFGEYLPWPWLFAHLSGFAVWAGDIAPGKSTGVVHAAGIPVGVATCWEVIFDRAARESVLGGAQLLAMPSNNATFDQTMSEQQLAFDKVRAVEHDRYVVVAGTVGISAVIAPDGHELSRTRFFEPAYLDTPVRLKTALTPATRWGPTVQWALVVAGIAVVVGAILHNWWFSGWFPRPNRRRRRPVGSGTPADGSDHAEDEDGVKRSPLRSDKGVI